MVRDVTVNLKCRLYWRLLDEYDNSGNKNQETSMKREVEVSTAHTISGKEYVKKLQELSTEEATKFDVSAEAGVQYGAASASVKSSYESSKNLKNFVSSLSEVTREYSDTTNTSIKQSFTIGAGDKLYFYQQVLSGDGFSIDLTTTSVTSTKKTSADDSELVIQVVAKPFEFIKGIDVCYGRQPSDAPSERVREYKGGNDDMNCGQKGDYVWLIPQYTFNAKEACTSFELRVQGEKVDAFKDLAKGAGKEYRYLIPVRDQRAAKRITKLALIRQDKNDNPKALTSRLGDKWAGATFDINTNRGGSFLWLAWEVC